MTSYEYWEHRDGERYVIRLDEAHLITGVCGPMRQSCIPAVNRHNFDYDAQPLHSKWIQAHTAEFRPIDTNPE